MPDENLSSQVQEEQETVTAPSSDDSKKWIKVVLFGIVGILITVGLVYAGYWYGIKNSNVKTQISKSQPKTQSQVTPISTLIPEPTTPPVTDPTAGWKTFSSNKGYQIKYSNTLIYEERVSGFYVFLESQADPMSQSFYIDERGEKTLAERREWLKDDLINAAYTDVAAAGVQGFIVEGEVGPGYGQGLQVKSAYIDFDGRELIIGCDINESCRSQTLNQILSTFKFLD